MVQTITQLWMAIASFFFAPQSADSALIANQTHYISSSESQNNIVDGDEISM